MTSSTHEWTYSTYHELSKKSGFVDVHCAKCGTTMRHQYIDEVSEINPDYFKNIFEDVCLYLENQFTDCEEARLLNMCDQIHSS
jgi:hypothetical protein